MNISQSNSECKLFDNYKDALEFIFNQHGDEVLLGDGETLRNYVSDYTQFVPQNIKNLVESVYVEGAAQILKNNLNASLADKELAVKIAIRKMTEANIVPDLAEGIIYEFAAVLGWKVSKQEPPIFPSEKNNADIYRTLKSLDEETVDANCKETIIFYEVASKFYKKLNEIIETEKSRIYIFMSITHINTIKDSLSVRINNGWETVVLFPHIKCVNEKTNKDYCEVQGSWRGFLKYLERNYVQQHLYFYYINNWKYEHLYSSCWTDSRAIYSCYEYSKDKKIDTRSGYYQVVPVGTSFYDIIKREYENAYYERITFSMGNHFYQYFG